MREELINFGVLESNMILVEPGTTYKLDDISFDTIASYNINKDYHKKEYNWVGYNVLLDGNKYYVIGDSDVIPEMNDVYADVSGYLSSSPKAGKFIGKTIRVRGFTINDNSYLPEGLYGLGKYGVSCCVADAGFMGFIINPDGHKIKKSTLKKLEEITR